MAKKGKADKNIQEKISWERPMCQKREELRPSSLKSPMLLLALRGVMGLTWGEPPQSPPALQSPQWHRSLAPAPSLLCFRGTPGWDCLLLAVSRGAPQTPFPGTQRRGISWGHPSGPCPTRCLRAVPSSRAGRSGRAIPVPFGLTSACTQRQISQTGPALGARHTACPGTALLGELRVTPAGNSQKWEPPSQSTM